MDIGLDNFLEDMKSLPEDTISDAGAVSYTHLDVYKRQNLSSGLKT